MHHFFKSKGLDVEIIHLLATAPYGGIDVPEVLEAVGEIKNGDSVHRHAAWAVQAQCAEALVGEASQSGDTESARQAYLRKSHYMRASGYMSVGDGPDQPDVALVHIVEKISELLRNLKGRTYYQGIQVSDQYQVSMLTQQQQTSAGYFLAQFRVSRRLYGSRRII